MRCVITCAHLQHERTEFRITEIVHKLQFDCAFGIVLRMSYPHIGHYLTAYHWRACDKMRCCITCVHLQHERTEFEITEIVHKSQFDCAFGIVLRMSYPHIGHYLTA